MSELRQLLTLAGAFKEGDLRIGGSPDQQTREEARRALSAVTLVRSIARTCHDGVTAALVPSRDRRHDAQLTALTVGGAAWRCSVHKGRIGQDLSRLAQHATPSPQSPKS